MEEISRPRRLRMAVNLHLAGCQPGRKDCSGCSEMALKETQQLRTSYILLAVGQGANKKLEGGSGQLS